MSADEVLIHGLKNADEAAFRMLLDMHQRKVYAIVIGFVRLASDAEDITQDVFIEAFESVKHFKAESQLSTWLHRIALHKCIDHMRARSRKKRFAILSSLFGDDDQIVVDQADPVHPGVLLEDKERAQILFAAIDRLPEQQRIAYTLTKIDDLSMKEAADVMKLSAKAVESLLSRARSNLQQTLRSYYDE